MPVKKRIKVIEVEEFVTSDGKTHGSEKDAKKHESVLAGIFDYCDICGGSGRNPYYSSHVGGSEPGCPACGGEGIVHN